MNELRSLTEKRVAVLAADGFEKVELTVPVHALKLAGAEVEIVSLRSGRLRGVNLHEPAGRVSVDKTLDQVGAQNYDALFIPGGFINPDLLRQSQAVRDFVSDFNAAGKPIAVICHSPWVLASADLLKGRKITSWPGIRDDLVNAGALWFDSPVVSDGNLLSSRGPQDLTSFVPALIKFFATNQALIEATPELTISDPQRQSPPELVLQTLRWLPKPSTRFALGLAALVGGGLYAAGKKLTRPSPSPMKLAA